MSPTVKRALGAIGLVAAGVLALPLVASVLDGAGTENLIIPVHLLLMAGIGAGVGVTLPALTGQGSTGRRALVGAVWGVLAALVGLLVFWFLLNGFGGA